MRPLASDSIQTIPAPGEVILGKYSVDRVIGEGGMGVVLAVSHVDIGERFAMKVLKPSALLTWRAPERFAREARAVSRLRSDHVARVYDVGQLENGLPFMILEYLEGRDLGSLLDEERSLSAAEAVDSVLLALDAVIEAHEQGIVHRDLKPANLFLAERPDGTLTIKVLDFGISKDLRGTAAQLGSVTHTSNVMGSPFYMSPEQMRSAKHVDHRADLWALGVILFELLTGEVPFPGETLTQVCANVIERPLPSIAELAPGTPPALIAVVEKSLRRDMALRFQTGGELKEALQEVAAELGRVPLGIKLTRVRRMTKSSPTGSSARPPRTSMRPSRAACSDIETLPAPAPTRGEATSRRSSRWAVLVAGLTALGLGFAGLHVAHAEKAPPVPKATVALGSVGETFASTSPKPTSSVEMVETVAPAALPHPKPAKVPARPAKAALSTPKPPPTSKHEGIY